MRSFWTALWRWTQSAANPSLARYPLSGKNTGKIYPFRRRMAGLIKKRRLLHLISCFQRRLEQGISGNTPHRRTQHAPTMRPGRQTLHNEPIAHFWLAFIRRGSAARSRTRRLPFLRRTASPSSTYSRYTHSRSPPSRLVQAAHAAADSHGVASARQPHQLDRSTTQQLAGRALAQPEPSRDERHLFS
jgi:hypothetical protein